jgi:hypothetical protein
MNKEYDSLDDIPAEEKHTVWVQIQFTFWIVCLAFLAIIVFVVLSPFCWIKHSRKILSAEYYPCRRLIWSLGSKHDLACQYLMDLPELMKDIWSKNY